MFFEKCHKSQCVVQKIVVSVNVAKKLSGMEKLGPAMVFNTKSSQLSVLPATSFVTKKSRYCHIGHDKVGV